MAQPKFENAADKRFTFFQRNRRLIRLDHIAQQVGGSKKKAQRITVFNCTVPLVAPFGGWPGFIDAAYKAVEQEDSFVSKAPLGDFKLQGISIEFFSDDSTKKKLEFLVNLTLYDFVVEKEKDVSVLRFKFKVQEGKRGFNLWLRHGMNEGLWADFIPAENALKQGDGVQMSLTGDDGPEEKQEETEEAVN